MTTIAQLVDNNRAWVRQTEKDRPGFFGALAKQQKPEFLWIGCADSRVPANEIVGLRSEERRVGKECRSMCRYRWSPDH
jgi:carbonic anhydrase